MEPRTDERSQDLLQDRGSLKHRKPILSEWWRIWTGRPDDVIESVLGLVELDHGGRRCKGSRQADRSTQRLANVEFTLRVADKGIVGNGAKCRGEVAFRPADRACS